MAKAKEKTSISGRYATNSKHQRTTQKPPKIGKYTTKTKGKGRKERSYSEAGGKDIKV